MFRIRMFEADRLRPAWASPRRARPLQISEVVQAVEEHLRAAALPSLRSRYLPTFLTVRVSSDDWQVLSPFEDHLRATIRDAYDRLGDQPRLSALAAVPSLEFTPSAELALGDAPELESDFARRARQASWRPGRDRAATGTGGREDAAPLAETSRPPDPVPGMLEALVTLGPGRGTARQFALTVCLAPELPLRLLEPRAGGNQTLRVEGGEITGGTWRGGPPEELSAGSALPAIDGLEEEAGSEEDPEPGPVYRFRRSPASEVLWAPHGRLILGREPGRVHWVPRKAPPNLSARHLVLGLAAGGELYAADLGSTNGTYLDGARLPAARRTSIRLPADLETGREGAMRVELRPLARPRERTADTPPDAGHQEAGGTVEDSPAGPPLKHALLGLLVFLLATLSPAAVLAGGLEPPSPTLRATGRATIYHGDLAGARDRAVEAALLRGLERYAGLRIEATTLIRRGDLVGRELRARTRGYVRSFEVLGSSRDGPEMTVEVELTVDDRPTDASFRRLTSATTTLLLVRESNLGRPIDGQVLPAVLADPFFTARLITPPADRLGELSRRVPERFYEAADPETVRELAVRFLAGIVVVAKAGTRPLDGSAGSLGYEVDAAVTRKVAAAEGNLTILDGRTGRVISAHRIDDVRGSDACDAERAGRRALAKLAGAMRELVVERLSAHLRELGFPLRIVARGDAAVDGGRRAAEALAATRWVEGVVRVREEAGIAVLEATCRENPFYVVEELRQAPGIEIVRFDAGLAEVEVR